MNIRGKCALVMVFILFFSGVLISATEKVDSLKNLLLTEKNDSNRIMLYHRLGVEIMHNSHYEGLEYFKKSEELADKLNSPINKVYALLGMSDIYVLIGEYRQGINATTEAIGLIPKDNHLLLSLSNSRLAIAYLSMREDSLSLIHNKISLSHNEILNDSVGIAYDYGNIAGYFLEFDVFDSALHYYDLSLEYLTDYSDPLYSVVLTNKGSIFVGKKEYAKALDFHFKSLAISEKAGYAYDIALEHSFISDAYYYYGKLDSAVYHNNLSTEGALKLSNHDLLVENYSLMYKIYEAKNDYKNALKYSRLEQLYSDSVSQKNKESEINTVRAQYEFEEQAKVLETTERNNDQLGIQKQVFLGLSIFTFGLFVASIVILVLKQKEHIKNQQLIVRLDKVNGSIRKLLSIIGHDLRSSVGSLKNFTMLMHHKLLDHQSIESLVAKFVPMVDSTHNLLETLLAWSKSTSEIFRPNVEELRSGLIIQQCLEQVEHLARTKQIRIVVEMEDVIFSADRNMLLTVLRNLISNAIKFSQPNSSVKVISLKMNEAVKFMVQDEGVGMTDDEVKKVLDENFNYHSEGTAGESGAGLGLSLCNDFVTKHGGKLNVSSKKGEGSEFSIIVPMKFTG